jgi:hypothetical protein
VTFQALDRRIYLIFHADTNRINARGALPAMNQLQKWDRDGVIDLHLPNAAFHEARAGGNPMRTRATALRIFTVPTYRNDSEKAARAQIARILFGAAQLTPNQENDVEIVFDARKHSAILVTNDGGSRRQPRGILGVRQALNDVGVRVMTDHEAVQLVRGLIAERDHLTKETCDRTGQPIPEWVGQD